MTKQEIIQVANEIKESFDKEVIKDIGFPQLVNKRTLEDVGICVIFQLSTKFDYDEATITGWKEKLGADDWYINVKRNQLFITFYVHFKHNNEKAETICQTPQRQICAVCGGKA